MTLNRKSVFNIPKEMRGTLPHDFEVFCKWNTIDLVLSSNEHRCVLVIVRTRRCDLRQRVAPLFI